MTTPTDIRLATLAVVAAALPTWTAHDSRITPLSDDELLEGPALVALTGTGVEEESEGGTGSYTRTEDVIVEAHFIVDPETPSPEAALAAQLDVLERGIKDALFRDTAWRNRFEDVARMRVTKGRHNESAHHRGAVVIAFTVAYHEGYGYEPDDDEDLSEVRIAVDCIVHGTGQPDGTIEAEAYHELEGA